MNAVPGRWRWYHDASGRKRDWFCEDVLSGKLAIRTVYEDDRVLAFHHPDPGAALHVVVVPKAHVASLLAPEMLDGELLRALLHAVQEVARSLGLDRDGFSLSANAAAPGVTPHVHWHVMGPGVPPPAPREQP